MSIQMRRPNLEDLPPVHPLPPGHDLRRATVADTRGLAVLLSAAFEDEWTEDRVRDKLIEAADVPATFVVAVAGDLVATASARFLPDRYPGSGYVHWVASHPSHRGKRLGAVVTLATLEYFRQAGYRDAVLETQAERLPAIRLYLSLGFRPEPLDDSHVATWREMLRCVQRT